MPNPGSHPSRDEQSGQPPVFILGNVRSGASMILGFFGLLEGVRTWFEPRTIWNYPDPARRHDRFTADDATPKAARYIRRRFEKVQARAGARIVEKTPVNVIRAPFVHAVFPNAKLIYIRREPLASIASAELRWRRPITLPHLIDRVLETPKAQLHHYALRAVHDHARVRLLRQKHVSIWGVRYPSIYEDRPKLPIEHIIAKQWAFASRTAREDLARIEATAPGTTLSVRYEDLVQNPAKTFAVMAAHAGLPTPESALERVSAAVDPSRRDKWKRLDPELISALMPYIEEEMRAAGYHPPATLPTEAERRAVLSAHHPISEGGFTAASLLRSTP